MLADSMAVEYLSAARSGAGIHAFTGRRARRPRQVVIRDYDERIAHVPLRSNAIVDQAGHGSVFEDGAPKCRPDHKLRFDRAGRSVLGVAQRAAELSRPHFRKPPGATEQGSAGRLDGFAAACAGRWRRANRTSFWVRPRRKSTRASTRMGPLFRVASAFSYQKSLCLFRVRYSRGNHQVPVLSLAVHRLASRV